jgi:ferritin-like metal-binding protein YciE
MNTKISTHSNSKIAEYLNEQLAMENAIADRLVPRIHETSIPDLKQHLEQNLRETMARQERMYQLITNLGGKPTDSKTDLPHLNQSYKNTIEELKNRVQSLTIDHDKDTKSAENEMHKIKEDVMIEAARAISYKILLRIAQHANIQDAILLLEQSIKEAESTLYWITDNTSTMIDKIIAKD